MKTITKSAVSWAMTSFLLGIILFICGCPYHRLDETPGSNINKEEEKHEHIPDTTDPVLLNRF